MFNQAGMLNQQHSGTCLIKVANNIGFCEGGGLGDCYYGLSFNERGTTGHLYLFFFGKG